MAMGVINRTSSSCFKRIFTHQPETTLSRLLFFYTAFLIAQGAFAQSPAVSLPFNFKQCLYTEARTLSSFVASLDAKNGEVVLNGYDGRHPDYFTFDWGDGTAREMGGFAMRHTYQSTARNYIASVMADYGTLKDTVEVFVRFIGPVLDRKEIPSRINIAVTIPSPAESLTLASRMPGYETPGDRRFPDTAFTLVSREDIEYLLTVAAHIQLEAADYKVEIVNGGFTQFVLYNPQMEGGMISTWYTSPVTFVAGRGAFCTTINWSSLFHEMGHNVTLNFPKAFRFGGRIDGNANALFSETMAQIFQHTTVFEAVNGYTEYGISPGIALEMSLTGLSSMRVMRNAYGDYVNGGRRFTSWNHPSTDEDETFGSFMTLAAVFVEEAEKRNDYRGPLRRMMEFLGKFNADLHEEYDQANSSAQADTFRATYMVAAISYGMNEDLRPRFKDLNFPISNETYTRLMGIVGNRQTPAPSIRDVPFGAEQTRAFARRTNVKTIKRYTLTGRKCDDVSCCFKANHPMHFKGKMPPGTYLFSLIGGERCVKIVMP